MNIKIINAGNCILCGQKIKIAAQRGSNKLPNIFFCPECDKRRIQAQKEMKKEVEE